MVDVGEFGARYEDVRPAEPDTFRFCGETIRVVGQVSGMAMLRAARAAASGMDDNDPRAAPLILDALEGCIDPADWPLFEETANANRVHPGELMRVLEALQGRIIETETARPTDRPADSSAGSPATGTDSSTPSSPGPVLLHPASTAPPASPTPLVAVPTGGAGYIASRAVTSASSPTPY